jgi:hypothetical protein
VNDSFEPVDLSPTRAELIARVRARGRQIRARRRLGIAGLAALVVIAIGAPAIAIGSRSTSHSIAPSHVDSAADLTADIELPGDEVVTGSEVHGTLVVVNNTARQVTLEGPGECHGKWAVTLTNTSVQPDVAFTQECGSERMVLAPGANRFPFTLSTSYHACSNSSNPAEMVRCLPGGGIPPLPPGNYQAVLVTSSPGFLPDAPQVLVRVVTAP